MHDVPSRLFGESGPKTVAVYSILENPKLD
jgi:hypothetical protein